MRGYISVTDYDTRSSIYINTSAIASITDCDGCTRIKIICGEYYIVRETVSEVCQRVEAAVELIDTQNKSKISNVHENVWISVENGLPDSRTDVRIAYIDEFNGRICTNCIAHVDKGRWYNSFTLDLVECKVSHWKPIRNDFVPGGAR